MTDKSTRWAFTAYEDQFRLFDGGPPPAVAEWGWNTEICPKSNRIHRQGYLLLRTQHRFAAVRKMFPGVHVEIAKDWNKLKEYCKKLDTRAPGTEPVVVFNELPTLYSYLDEVVERLPYWNEVREMWMAHCEAYLDYKRAVERKLVMPNIYSTEQPLYSDVNDFAYHVLVKDIVDSDVQAGRPGIAFIVQNPLWITTAKNQIKNLIIQRHGLTPRFTPRVQTDRQTDTFEVSF